MFANVENNLKLSVFQIYSALLGFGNKLSYYLNLTI